MILNPARATSGVGFIRKLMPTRNVEGRTVKAAARHDRTFQQALRFLGIRHRDFVILHGKELTDQQKNAGGCRSYSLPYLLLPVCSRGAWARRAKIRNIGYGVRSDFELNFGRYLPSFGQTDDNKRVNVAPTNLSNRYRDSMRLSVSALSEQAPNIRQWALRENRRMIRISGFVGIRIRSNAVRSMRSP